MKRRHKLPVSQVNDMKLKDKKTKGRKYTNPLLRAGGFHVLLSVVNGTIRQENQKR